MGDLLQPVHVMLLFGWLLPVGFFIWAVQRISRAIENAGRRSRNDTMRNDG